MHSDKNKIWIENYVEGSCMYLEVFNRVLLIIVDMTTYSVNIFIRRIQLSHVKQKNTFDFIGICVGRYIVRILNTIYSLVNTAKEFPMSLHVPLCPVHLIKNEREPRNRFIGDG